MKSKLIEVTNQFNFGKFLVGRFDDEWSVISQIDVGRPLLRASARDHQEIMVFDLQTGEGAMFRPGGLASADLRKHRVWVCPMFEPFLCWLYRQDLSDLDALPSIVNFTMEETAEFTAMYGYRREGPDGQA